MTDAAREWTRSDRLRWWSILLTLATLLGGMAFAGFQWGSTRASKEELSTVARTLDEKKEDKVNADKERERIAKGVDEQKAVLQNVRDNLLIMMERQRLEAKPLPPRMSDGQP